MENVEKDVKVEMLTNYRPLKKFERLLMHKKKEAAKDPYEGCKRKDVLVDDNQIATSLVSSLKRSCLQISVETPPVCKLIPGQAYSAPDW